MIRVLRKLWEGDIRYLLVGGLALNLWGIPRTTYDIDIMLDLSSDENIRKFVESMKELGLKLKQPIDLEKIHDKNFRERIFREKEAVVLTFENLENPIEIVDFFTENPINFESAWRRRKEVKVADFFVRLAHPDDIISLKRISGRPQDIEDIKALEKLKKLI